ncbi:conserved hypothetical protein [Vibrio crassostreae]|nr:conserved hypothetical protein [Vibrio crassostreae]CAK2808793.1 conserved hypothetical protein [Vibrio crassostreae]CAK3287933.1 conserved hypothetical protein [Vibrio crassostreae]CAK3849466.1 conserved hypothetical protein [Vibrio crassostreae]
MKLLLSNSISFILGATVTHYLSEESDLSLSADTLSSGSVVEGPVTPDVMTTATLDLTDIPSTLVYKQVETTPTHTLIGDTPENSRTVNWSKSSVENEEETQISWNDIERLAPHLSYEEKLDLETLSYTDPSLAVTRLAKEAQYPNTGDPEKDILLNALSGVSPVVSHFVVTLDSMYMDKCGTSLLLDSIKEIMNVNSDLFFQYKKMNYSALKEEFNNSIPCDM